MRAVGESKKIEERAEKLAVGVPRNPSDAVSRHANFGLVGIGADCTYSYKWLRRARPMSQCKSVLRATLAIKRAHPITFSAKQGPLKEKQLLSAGESRKKVQL